MSSNRLARALLRLYPRDWRARYGDEFLAFIGDAGLTWRGALDIAGAAIVQRVRVLVALATYDLALASADDARGIGDGERFADFCAFMVFVIGLVWTLAWLGGPLPSWAWWFCVANRWSTDLDGLTSTSIGASERLIVSAGWFAAAVGLAAVGHLTALALSAAGVLAPADWLFIVVTGGFTIAAGARGIYCGIHARRPHDPWPGLGLREMIGWNLCLFLVMVFGMLDPEAPAGVFWYFAFGFWIALRPSFHLTRAGVAHRRAREQFAAPEPRATS